MTKIVGETGIGIGTGIATGIGTGIAKVGITVKEGNTETAPMITEAVIQIGMPVNMHLITLQKTVWCLHQCHFGYSNCILEMSD